MFTVLGNFFKKLKNINKEQQNINNNNMHQYTCGLTSFFQTNVLNNYSFLINQLDKLSLP